MARLAFALTEEVQRAIETIDRIDAAPARAIYDVPCRQHDAIERYEIERIIASFANRIRVPNPHADVNHDNEKIRSPIAR